jgi:hypothetical protein
LECNELLVFGIPTLGHKLKTAKSKMLSMDQGSMLSYGRPKPKALNFPNIGTEV